MQLPVAPVDWDSFLLVVEFWGQPIVAHDWVPFSDAFPCPTALKV